MAKELRIGLRQWIWEYPILTMIALLIICSAVTDVVKEIVIACRTTTSVVVTKPGK